MNYADPFGLCPGINGTDQNDLSDCPSESSRSFWDRLWNGPRYIDVDAQRVGIVSGVVPDVGPGGLVRSTATLARHTTRFANAVKALDARHLSAAARELAGEVTGWDHVTEVRSSMNSLRNTIRSMNGFLKNPNLSAELRAGGEQLLKNAQEALRRAEEVIR